MESLIFSIITPVFSLVVDRLSVPILSIFMIIGIGNFQNRFADKNITFWSPLFGSDAACRNLPLCVLEQSPPTAHLNCWESRVRPIKAESTSLTPKVLANWSFCSNHASVLSERQQQTLLKWQLLWESLHEHLTASYEQSYCHNTLATEGPHGKLSK